MEAVNEICGGVEGCSVGVSGGGRGHKVWWKGKCDRNMCPMSLDLSAGSR